MKKPGPLLRMYGMPDGVMLQQSDVQLALFIENEGRFVSFFPNLSPPFAHNWGVANKAAQAMFPDYASVAKQTGETASLETMMESGRNLYQTLVLYTQLAFPKNATVLRLMGQAEYEKARNNQLKLPALLRMAFAQASETEYKNALLAKGMKETDIAAMQTLADCIANQGISQEKAKKSRTLDANNRISAMNAVWGKMALVSQCAKLVFQNDAALYAMFLLHDSPSPTPEVPPTPIVGG